MAAAVPEVAGPSVQRLSGTRLADFGAPFLVWGIWGVASAALVVVVAQCTANVPLWDEWQMVPVLTRPGPPSPQWLWAPWSEHRVPLPRLALVGLFRVTKDFRTPVFLDVMALSTLAGALVLVSARVRGWTSYSDAFFPLLLLHPGHGENVLQGWDLQNVLFGILVCGIVMLGAGPRGGRPGALLAGGLFYLLLPLDGAAGAVMVPALALWLVVAGWTEARRARRVVGTAAVLMAVAGLAVLWLYGHGLPPNTRPWPEPAAGLVGALMFLASSLGPAGRAGWPATAALAALLVCAAGLTALTAWRARGADRKPLIGLLFVLAGLACVALAVGMGRSIFRKDFALEARYGLLAAPALVAAYLAGASCRPATAGRALQFLLLIAVCSSSAVSWSEGLRQAYRHRQRIESFTADVASGVPASFLLARHDWLIPRWNPDQAVEPAYLQDLESCLADLRRANVGVFARLRDMPAARSRSLASVPDSWDHADWSDGFGVGDGPASAFTFALDRPRKVYGLVLDCTLNESSPDSGPAQLTVSWTPRGPGPPRLITRVFELNTGRKARRVAIWVDATIDRFTVRPDVKPVLFRPLRIELLEPATEH